MWIPRVLFFGIVQESMEAQGLVILPTLVINIWHNYDVLWMVVPWKSSSTMTFLEKSSMMQYQIQSYQESSRTF